MTGITGEGFGRFGGASESLCSNNRVFEDGFPVGVQAVACSFRVQLHGRLKPGHPRLACLIWQPPFEIV